MEENREAEATKSDQITRPMAELSFWGKPRTLVHQRWSNNKAKCETVIAERNQESEITESVGISKPKVKLTLRKETEKIETEKVFKETSIDGIFVSLRGLKEEEHLGATKGWNISEKVVLWEVFCMENDIYRSISRMLTEYINWSKDLTVIVITVSLGKNINVHGRE